MLTGLDPLWCAQTWGAIQRGTVNLRFSTPRLSVVWLACWSKGPVREECHMADKCSGNVLLCIVSCPRGSNTWGP